MKDDLLIQRASARMKNQSAYPLKTMADYEIAQRNFEVGLRQIKEQNGPSVLCEAVRPGERSTIERRIQE